jgi:RiboL-PSP-HEPN
MTTPEEKAVPSASLLQWQNDRIPRLNEIDIQCAASLELTSPNPLLVDENLRGYIILLSAHFQGFCRDLYTESSQIIASKVRVTLQVLIQAQFTAHRALDHGNPNLENLKKDFNRFGFKLNLAAADPANHRRLQDLSDLNKWRNIVAHQGTVPPGGLPALSDLRTWRNSCDGLAASLDRIMYNELRRMLKRAPWVP